MALLDGIWAILVALVAGDAWMLSEALNDSSAYVIGFILVLGGGFLLMKILHLVPVLDDYFERFILVSIYLSIAAIIFIEVIRRFIFQVQAPWSTTLPPYLFLIMTWVGCAYNTKLRTHLSFPELRNNLPRIAQLWCLFLDAFLWLIFALIVIVTTLKQTANSAANFQILLGTDDVMQWWFYICVPLSWLLLSARVLENLMEDFDRYRKGEPMIVSQVSVADD